VFTTAILAFINTWNEFMLAKQLSTTATEPVTVAIARFSGSNAYEYPYAAVMAAGAIVTVPLVIMVLVFQRRIVSGLTAGGVK
jgi:multiple sugar transport system permease protein